MNIRSESTIGYDNEMIKNSVGVLGLVVYIGL